MIISSNRKCSSCDQPVPDAAESCGYCGQWMGVLKVEISSDENQEISLTEKEFIEEKGINSNEILKEPGDRLTESIKLETLDHQPPDNRQPNIPAAVQISSPPPPPYQPQVEQQPPLGVINMPNGPVLPHPIRPNTPIDVERPRIFTKPLIWILIVDLFIFILCVWAYFTYLRPKNQSPTNVYSQPGSIKTQQVERSSTPTLSQTSSTSLFAETEPVKTTVTHANISTAIPSATLSTGILTKSPVAVTPLATPTGGGQWIAYGSNRTGHYEIYIVNVETLAERQVTFLNVDSRVPSWSPDGKSIAFQSNDGGDYEIMIVSLTSGQIKAVTNNQCDDFNPVWSPDGIQFAFYSDCDGNREIFTMNVDGGNRRQLTHTTDKYNWFPCWSPDGKKISFSSNSSGNYFIYEMKKDGSNLIPLARGCSSTYSPDGKRIVYTSYCSDFGKIYVMDSTGNNIKTLDDKDRSRVVSWSPDANWLVFQSNQSGNIDIWTMELSSSTWRRLTTNPAEDSSAVWRE